MNTSTFCRQYEEHVWSSQTVSIALTNCWWRLWQKWRMARQQLPFLDSILTNKTSNACLKRLMESIGDCLVLNYKVNMKRSIYIYVFLFQKLLFSHYNNGVINVFFFKFNDFDLLHNLGLVALWIEIRVEVWCWIGRPPPPHLLISDQIQGGHIELSFWWI